MFGEEQFIFINTISWTGFLFFLILTLILRRIVARDSEKASEDTPQWDQFTRHSYTATFCFFLSTLAFLSRLVIMALFTEMFVALAFLAQFLLIGFGLIAAMLGLKSVVHGEPEHNVGSTNSMKQEDIG